MTTSNLVPSPGRCFRIHLRKWSLLALLAAACLLLGIVIAESDWFYNDPDDPAPTAAGTDSRRDAGTSLAAAPGEPGPLTLQSAIDIANEHRKAMQNIWDYTANFSKRERINGRLRKQVIKLKLRSEPFSVYLLYESKREAGRQGIYVAGKYDDCLVCKDVGFRGLAGTLRLGIQNPLVMSESRYPVTYLGIANVIDMVRAAWEKEAKLDGVRPVVEINSDAWLGEITCQQLQVIHQQQHSDIEFQITRLYFDKETGLPIQAERYGWPQEVGEEPPLMEEYTYSDLKVNVGLTDADFDPAQYGF